MPFTCSICGEESVRICARCTKDACNNHLCERCNRCSDCCECEVVLNGQPPSARSVFPRHEPVVVPVEPVAEPLEDAVPSEEPVFEESVFQEEVVPSEEPIPDEPVLSEDPDPSPQPGASEAAPVEETNPSGEPPSDQFS